ncbi:hypothetical protein [Shewanella baltica]|uniref:Uncharacterized protein n=1 Tax=Shewanella baltica (strain OS155 / ATCC BAA-1091) TaxID=325240 RepID=A3D409_SHEB5|nr:hypothetical protein [Shewanella baltica]ABN61472.1 hypothetical protein Sbal_1968 [Shewanella baltica OS155]AEH13821.1 hypothetical protein Sbal117_2084 [Shewanella baltica OS117]MCS6122999.1 type III secretion apparatus [Shewanella baltica]MCS6180895.1 type III secretion apparatus [Shewanella baltica]MCS6237290.1 type III secretion apparatus [Shewanella baltica]
MDLQLTRNLEQFFRLVNHWPVKLEARIECHWPPHGVLLECHQGRLLMTTWLLNTPVRDLKPHLSRWHPEAFAGRVQRLFIVKNRLMISCLCPSTHQGHDWYHLYQLQQKFLNRMLIGGQ